MDPVQNQLKPDRSINSDSSNNQFIIPLCVLLLTAYQGTVQLAYEASTGSDSLANISSSPFIFTHQISPRSVWSQIDFSIGFDMLAGVAMCCALIATPFVPDQFRIICQEIDHGQIRMGSKGKLKKLFSNS